MSVEASKPASANPAVLQDFVIVFVGPVHVTVLPELEHVPLQFVIDAPQLTLTLQLPPAMDFISLRESFLSLFIFLMILNLVNYFVI